MLKVKAGFILFRFIYLIEGLENWRILNFTWNQTESMPTWAMGYSQYYNCVEEVSIMH